MDGSAIIYFTQQGEIWSSSLKGPISFTPCPECQADGTIMDTQGKIYEGTCVETGSP